MCGRFAAVASPEIIKRYFHLNNCPDYQTSYNIAPSQQIPIITEKIHQREMYFANWGFKPAWAKADTRLAPFNARIETIFTNRLFKSAIKYQRCIIPASGYFEWQKTTHPKQPYFIHQRHSSITLLAGIYSEVNDNFTVAILTCAAHPKLSFIHSRMPLILSEASWDSWITEDSFSENDIEQAMERLMKIDFEFWPVTPRMSSARFNQLEAVVSLKRENE